MARKTSAQLLHEQEKVFDQERRALKEQIADRDRQLAEIRARLADIHYALQVLQAFAIATPEEALFS